jgi:excinuclease ABC subunit C
MTDPRETARRLPLGPGVYRFRDRSGRVLYIGRARTLRRRVQSYWSNLGDRPYLVRMVARIARVEAAWCDSEHEAACLERNLLQHAKPPWNRADSGGEVVGYIRVDTERARPGLRLAHKAMPGAPHFGPYLGGLRIRQAISGLHRVLPLAYTAATNASARELAHRLGIGPNDRDTLAQTAIAVLERDPAAVTALRAELGRRRDRAAEQLSFELAAKLQDEIIAFDWIMAEQKVTRMTPSDLDIYGWADGILVRFRMRAGRLCTWTQRATREKSARDRVARTPAAWRTFAQRNAELAARLLLDEGPGVRFGSGR